MTPVSPRSKLEASPTFPPSSFSSPPDRSSLFLLYVCRNTLIGWKGKVLFPEHVVRPAASASLPLTRVYDEAPDILNTC
jgi:hypothetical protein